jgi:hypothetical protein
MPAPDIFFVSFSVLFLSFLQLSYLHPEAVGPVPPDFSPSTSSTDIPEMQFQLRSGGHQSHYKHRKPHLRQEAPTTGFSLVLYNILKL